MLKAEDIFALTLRIWQVWHKNVVTSTYIVIPFIVAGRGAPANSRLTPHLELFLDRGVAMPGVDPDHETYRWNLDLGIFAVSWSQRHLLK